VAFKNYYRVWEDLIRITTRWVAGSRWARSGFIYQTYGFTYIEELELLREAGLTPLEVIRAATSNGAVELQSPKQDTIDFGIIRPGKQADLCSWTRIRSKT